MLSRTKILIALATSALCPAATVDSTGGTSDFGLLLSGSSHYEYSLASLLKDFQFGIVSGEQFQFGLNTTEDTENGPVLRRSRSVDSPTGSGGPTIVLGGASLAGAVSGSTGGTTGGSSGGSTAESTGGGGGASFSSNTLTSGASGGTVEGSGGEGDFSFTPQGNFVYSPLGGPSLGGANLGGGSLAGTQADPNPEPATLLLIPAAAGIMLWRRQASSRGRK